MRAAASYPGTALTVPKGQAYYVCTGEEPWMEWLPVLWRLSSHFAVRLVSVQAPEKLDHFDQLKVRDRRRKLDVIYVREWTPSAESPS
jgi:hypothetical protein